jgi:menaquinone-dependent protoporphyrinogen IX oxidase
MKTLVVYYSKTGTTKAVAGAAQKKLCCDLDEILYDQKEAAIQTAKDPAEYDRVILLSPVWAFSLAEPVKLYLKKHKSGIKAYSLIVTCSMFGIGGCVKACVKLLGKNPEKALCFKAKQIKPGIPDFEV